MAVVHCLKSQLSSFLRLNPISIFCLCFFFSSWFVKLQKVWWKARFFPMRFSSFFFLTPTLFNQDSWWNFLLKQQFNYRPSLAIGWGAKLQQHANSEVAKEAHRTKREWVRMRRRKKTGVQKTTAKVYRFVRQSERVKNREKEEKSLYNEIRINDHLFYFVRISWTLQCERVAEISTTDTTQTGWHGKWQNFLTVMREIILLLLLLLVENYWDPKLSTHTHTKLFLWMASESHMSPCFTRLQGLLPICLHIYSFCVLWLLLFVLSDATFASIRRRCGICFCPNNLQQQQQKQHQKKKFSHLDIFHSEQQL